MTQAGERTKAYAGYADADEDDGLRRAQVQPAYEAEELDGQR